jgi:hypothetical protein
LTSADFGSDSLSAFDSVWVVSFHPDSYFFSPAGGWLVGWFIGRREKKGEVASSLLVRYAIACG